MGGRRAKEEMTHMKILMSKPLALLPSPGQRQKWPGDLSDIPVVVVSLAPTATYEKRLKNRVLKLPGVGIVLV